MQKYKTPRGYLGYGDEFLDTTPKAQSMKEIIDNTDFFKIYLH